MKPTLLVLGDVLSVIDKIIEQNQNFVQNKILQMTLYKHLGPITFQYQTQMFELFSASNQTLILQFKHYEDIVLEEITQLLSVYQLILKEDKLLEIYTQKNKSSSILVHSSSRVVFDKISIQLLCRIIKETIISIFHSTKLIPGKIGEISADMFFQINGQLRFLYFPVCKYNSQSQSLVSDVFDFFNRLKDDKEISHRLLLKKISKCNTLQQILEETQYFQNIYHARQSSTFASTIQYQNPAYESYFGRTLNKTKFGGKNLNQSSVNQFRNCKISGQTVQIVGSKNNSRRKYNLFNNPDVKNTISPQYNFSSSTWRKTKKQGIFQSNTFRTNSKAVHIDLSQRGAKNQSTSLFSRASSLNHTAKKLSNSKRKGQGMSLHSHANQNYAQTNQSFLKSKNQHGTKRSGTQQNLQANEISQLNESSVSRKINESQCKVKYEEPRNNQSSQWMKKMVNNSLEKWRQKSNEKGAIFSKMNDKDRERSTQVDSRSKFLEKYERPSYNTLQESNVSSIHHNNFTNQRQSYLQNDDLSYKGYAPASQKKLKRINANRSALVDAPKIQKNQVNQKIEKSSQQFQFCPNNNFLQNKNRLSPSPQESGSIEQIDLCQSSIEHLAMKNKEEELKLSKHMERKKTSIKELVDNKNVSQNVSDESQTQRIQYSRCSKKNVNTKPEPQQSNKSISPFKAEIQQLQNKLKEIFTEKAQIDYIGVAVVETAEHLKSFESIFWQLPMFFLYKKFYEKRLKLCQKINELHAQTISAVQESKDFKQIEMKVSKYSSQIQPENVNIEECLKKLLKTVKKKIKKEYPQKEEQRHIEKHLHLDYTVNYDSVIDEFALAYLKSLIEAQSEFPELTFHIVEILQAVVVIKGRKIEPKDREAIEKSKNKSSKLSNTEEYYNSLLKKKQIKNLFNPPQTKGKAKN